MRKYATPQRGDVVLCCKPFSSGGGTIHPAVITGMDAQPDIQVVEIVLGSSRVDRVFPGDIIIAPDINAAEYAATGLSRPTRFKTDTILNLPYDSEHFAVPQNRRFGDTPKIGIFLISALERLIEAYRMLTRDNARR